MAYRYFGSGVPIPMASHGSSGVCCTMVEDTAPIDVATTASEPDFTAVARVGHGGPPVVVAGTYELLERLGAGGMSMVFRAERVGCREPVAIKILDAEFGRWPDAFASFVREAQMAARIHHANVVEIAAFGTTPRGLIYLVMELLRGRTLAELSDDGGLSWRWARYIMRQVCAGMHAIHRAGIIHRDLKASNCFFLQDNARVKIFDLGIAGEEFNRIRAASGERAVIGTPGTMAPEQVRGDRLDRRADVYAAGILLVQLLTGRLPFEGSVESVLDQQLHRPPPPVRELAPERSVPAGLDELVGRALAKDRDARYPSMAALDKALSQLDDEDG